MYRWASCLMLQLGAYFGNTHKHSHAHAHMPHKRAHTHTHTHLIVTLGVIKLLYPLRASSLKGRGVLGLYLVGSDGAGHVHLPCERGLEWLLRCVELVLHSVVIHVIVDVLGILILLVGLEGEGEGGEEEVMSLIRFCGMPI